MLHSLRKVRKALDRTPVQSRLSVYVLATRSINHNYVDLFPGLLIAASFPEQERHAESRHADFR
jgi:hypothetical protein